MEDTVKAYFSKFLLSDKDFSPSICYEGKKFLSKMQFSLSLNHNELKRRVSSYVSKEKYPSYVTFEFAHLDKLPMYKSLLLKITSHIPSTPLLKDIMQKHKDQISILFLELMEHIPLKHICYKTINGHACQRGSLEEYLANDILREYLEMFTWIFYAVDFLEIQRFVNEQKNKGIGDLFHNVFNRKINNDVRYELNIPPKKGDVFFGINANDADFSVSAHKEIYTKNANIAKTSFRREKMPEKDDFFIYTVVELTARNYVRWLRGVSLKEYEYDDDNYW